MPGDGLIPPTNTFRIYEEEAGILDSFKILSFKGGVISLNKNLFITDFDFDFDGGDFLFTLDSIPNTTDNFLLGVKNSIETEGEPTTFSIDPVLDGDLDIENFNYENQQMLFVDLTLILILMLFYGRCLFRIQDYFAYFYKTNLTNTKSSSSLNVITSNPFLLQLLYAPTVLRVSIFCNCRPVSSKSFEW